VLNILVCAVGSYQINSILVWCGQTRKAALFDPGAEADRLISEIRTRNLDLVYLLTTHGHLDHIADNHVVKAEFDAPLLIHALDRPMLTDPARNLSLFTGDSIVSPDADGLLAEGDVLQIGQESLTAYHIPGHSPGSLVFYQPGLLISGDTLFCGGVGRTDFPGCSERDLHENIRKKIYGLPEGTIVYPGHGPTTTVGEERRTNPFVRA
jgi:glyoxylase-like metal-dependent hydrolase (beta-lactamase superfamily II)